MYGKLDGRLLGELVGYREENVLGTYFRLDKVSNFGNDFFIM